MRFEVLERSWCGDQSILSVYCEKTLFLPSRQSFLPGGLWIPLTVKRGKTFIVNKRELIYLLFMGMHWLQINIISPLLDNNLETRGQENKTHSDRKDKTFVAMSKCFFLHQHYSKLIKAYFLQVKLTYKAVNNSSF